MKVIEQEECTEIKITAGVENTICIEQREPDLISPDIISLESSSIVPFIKAIEMSEEQEIELAEYFSKNLPALLEKTKKDTINIFVKYLNKTGTTIDRTDLDHFYESVEI